MADQQQISKLKQGREEWNRWRAKNAGVYADLSGADLRGLVLREANLSGGDLRRTNLSEADLTGAELSSANLSGADLAGTNLRWADLRQSQLCEADLEGADLYKADLGWANLSGANLRRTAFSQTRIGWTIFADVDLSMAKELEAAIHYGPSTIGLDTIYRSKGKIADHFLLGIGVPKSAIPQVKLLATSACCTRFSSVFISHSTKDERFAARLCSNLQENGVRCWYAPHHMKGGEKIGRQIQDAIACYDKLLIVLSNSSMRSQWVRVEIANAKQREVQGSRRVLFPIRLVSVDRIRKWECLDTGTGRDMGPEIREYFIPDFSNWQEENFYQRALQALLRDLESMPEVDSCR